MLVYFMFSIKSENTSVCTLCSHKPTKLSIPKTFVLNIFVILLHFTFISHNQILFVTQKKIFQVLLQIMSLLSHKWHLKEFVSLCKQHNDHLLHVSKS